MPRSFLGLVTATLLLAATTTTARGEMPRKSDRADAGANPLGVPFSTPGRQWYGWKLLLADGAEIAALAICIGAGGETPCWVPAFAYALSGPIIHARHRGVPRALGSLAFRLGLPVLGMYAGTKLADCNNPSRRENCQAGEQLVLGTLGVVAAIAIDAIWAFDYAPAQPESPASAARASVSVQPMISFGRGSGAGLGLVGRF
jgi:hypothetical protein